MEHKIIDVLEQTLLKLKNIVDVDTVVGNPIKTQEGDTIIPLTKISVGFVAGGGEYPEKSKKKQEDDYPFAGGSGGGFSVTPLGFLLIKGSSVKVINVEKSGMVEKLYDVAQDLCKSLKKD